MNKPHTGVEVIEDFQKFDQFMKQKELPLSEFGVTNPHPNMLLVVKSGKYTALGIIKGDVVRYIPFDQKIHNIKSRNKEQDMLITLLRDPEIECLTICGPAGSGKTLLALACAMEQLRAGAINKIVLCKNLTPLGREIGFLKGDMDDKIRPWAGNFLDNFEVLGVPYYELDDMFDKYSDRQKEHPGHIELVPTTFLQGRSISHAVIIVDEAQNLTREVIKQILTRPAENSKIILLGDVTQVIEKGANGFELAVAAGKGAEFVGLITLLKCVRSKVAEWFSGKL